MKLAHYSFGTGDRFGLQGNAQLAAVRQAEEAGIELAIVWNKSHREHSIVGTSQEDVRREADAAVKSAGWKGSYHVDADHIGLANVDLFLSSSDFFTLDVADAIGQAAAEQDIQSFIHRYSGSIGELEIAGLSAPLCVTADQLRTIAEKYLFAIEQAARIYQHISAKKNPGTFITEVSLDETAEPQSPAELFFILAAIADRGIPAQTIAPKFTGRFNKGVDYQGDVEQFNLEFDQDICVIKEAIRRFGLPADLKLSVHSGSDKFAIYPGIKKAVRKHGSGVHVKTAGTTWLEELIGLAESGAEGLSLVKEIYRAAHARFDELCGPYASVIDIDRKNLPAPDSVDDWDGLHLAQALRHDQTNPSYNSDIRQMLHVAYKVAAEYGDVYLDLVRKNEDVIAHHVCTNLYERHIKPLFL